MEEIVNLVQKSIEDEKWSIAYHEEKIKNANANLTILENQLIELKSLINLSYAKLQSVSDNEL
jgi:hypothetical protein